MSLPHPEAFPHPTPTAPRASSRSKTLSSSSFFSLVTLLLFLILADPSLLSAQDTPEVIRQKIEAAYPLTKTTASKDDIVTAGAVLVLEKDNLEMSTVATQSQAQDTYKGGKISPSAMTGLMKWNRKLPGHSDAAGTTRTFVAGEKFWLTKVDVKDDGVYLSFFSDPISDVRYVSILKFPYEKGSSQHSASDILVNVGEVIKVQPSDDAKAAPANTPAAPAPGTATPAQTYAAIPPPPPPTDAPPPAPKTVAIGQTKDQVVAMFGAPTRILDKGATKIYVYPDMKVTFKSDKVSDIN